ncbi:MAG: RDD family protein [Candidatus Hinthialibacteria bacterium OLB16]|nr:MAG: RDD family protein [Candidatus Hinthialibacteria bacterium OLB16]
MEPRELLQAALEKAQAQHYEEARSLLEQLTQALPEFADGHYYLGLTQARLGETHRAMAAFERCLALDPFYHAAREQLKLLQKEVGASSLPPSAPPPPPKPASEAYAPLWVRPEDQSIDRTIIPKPAGFWIRAAAFAIDYFLFSLVLEPFIFLASIPFFPLFDEYAGMDQEEMVTAILNQFLQGDTGPMLSLLAASLVLMTVGFLLNSLIFGYFHYTSGQTPGKRLLGIRAVDYESLGYLGFGQSMWRYAASTLNWCICGIGYLMAAFNPEKRTLHDYMAGTRVVYSEKIPMSLFEMILTLVMVGVALAVFFMRGISLLIAIREFF